MDVNSSRTASIIGKSATIEKTTIWSRDTSKIRDRKQQQEITTRTLATVRWTAEKTAKIGTSQI